MAQITVGVRELKAQLSRYLRQVAQGDTVVITERGKPIGQIVPVELTLAQRMQRLIDAGVVTWDGKNPEPVEPVAVNESGILLSDLIVEDRG